MFTKAIVIFFAGLAAAQKHAPVGEPKGNPISKPLNEIVPACKPFTITWEPTTPNTVSILLLKGPSTNVVKFGPALAEGIANSGTLSWTPSSDLEETATAQGYGIQIIDDVTGQYQYSTQFGISKKECGAASSAPVSTPAASTPAASTPAASTPAPVTSTAAGATPMAPHPTTTICTTAGPYANATVVVPVGTGSMTLSPSASMPGNATTSHPPEVTVNAASGVQAGLTFAGAVAAMAMMI
ncbi:GPI anchored serine-threonine rich protein [Pyrenophora tritici-repentis]|uniref:Ser-Thr-rich glycosyl-phosphatidyl-inositol-anchored membrane protein n=2 Tax=Pyrenophora tritici-repentis TaxID=45151 RepID=A0A922NIC3_9PLEO|nr:GPI anchored serine-threonine rich protein [Pyrenophora tritici-repentis Pt-1C-BFP]KAI1516456.1 Ser-Thr-rich glycosyl-phosphatidyl-inositol-anchored membrane protein [Pyrenophora tritici-repentis]EDU43729.1 GPI anchored serine-threonine rich protein [Pyrenophora tritici-repentis Pt-1C-BFP]KAI1538385.1 GPI anchored serine-threonine rich protein [Pyrenophora tritici-repentis]KAI1552990.1 GPI anchored serine-threonine rich protein [Pyrenophora tritici-repentis]KAI1571439.1 GPI anchored serine-